MTLQNQDDQIETFGWNDLLLGGFVELIDCTEEETIMCAMNLEDLEESRKPNAYTRNYIYCEIHSSMILGICGFYHPIL